jgi:outer membrane immunogenic protein
MGFRRTLALAILAAWGLGAQADPARADGAVVPADDYSPYAPSGFFVYDWTGFYGGAHLGGAHAEADSTEVLFPDNPVLFQGFTFQQSETSVTGGVQAGYQRQWGKLVAGFEAGLSLVRFDNTSEAEQEVGLESELVAGLTRSVEASDIFTFTGRLGYADGRWLAYAKAGVASAQVDVTYRDSRTGATTSSDGRETGWTAGVGIDYALTQNLFLGLEYNYVHFRSDVRPPPIPEAQFDDVDVDIQSVVVRLNYRFGGCCHAAGPPYGP